MKKLLKSCLIALLAAAFMVTPVLAAGTPSVSVSSATAEAGKTVTLNISIANNPGFVSGKVTLTYDTSALKLTAMENKMFQGFANPESGKANHSSVTPVTGDGILVSATFQIADTAAAGSYNVSADVSGMRDKDGNMINVSGGIGTVTVTEPVCEHVMGDWTVTREATCTAEGEKTRKCVNCDYTETAVIEKLSHTYGEWKETKAPTCTEKGEESRSCTCGATETREVAAKGHSFGEWKVTKAATCTKKGVETRTCACGATETREIAAKGHSFGEWKVTKAATCTEKGEKTRQCDCGYTETKAIAATGHALTKMNYDANGHWYVCANCGYTSQKEAHDFENSGMCKCGYKNPAAETADDSELDDVPKTGDITPVINVTAIAVICMLAAAAFGFKRRITK